MLTRTCYQCCIMLSFDACFCRYLASSIPCWVLLQQPSFSFGFTSTRFASLRLVYVSRIALFRRASCPPWTQVAWPIPMLSCVARVKSSNSPSSKKLSTLHGIFSMLINVFAAFVCMYAMLHSPLLECCVECRYESRIAAVELAQPLSLAPQIQVFVWRFFTCPYPYPFPYHCPCLYRCHASCLSVLFVLFAQIFDHDTGVYSISVVCIFCCISMTLIVLRLRFLCLVGSDEPMGRCVHTRTRLLSH
jgi:hypothetical protein